MHVGGSGELGVVINRLLMLPSSSADGVEFASNGSVKKKVDLTSAYMRSGIIN